ncbi:serine/threonine protein kinase [Myxococcota bacterium]|nr:serine/threonine protein kinase [Myxococcota bacterium]
MRAQLPDRYTLDALLGQGGQGEVWRAKDTLVDNRPVAVKLLRADAPSPLARREVAALLALDLPGVVRLYDEGRCPLEGGGETRFLVMELVAGEPFFPGGTATWDTLRGPLVSLLRVLRRVHAAGVIHRDLKPANVLRRGDEVTLLDLGVAAGEGADAAPPLEADEIGDERYMAPEQLRDPERVTPAADLYAVGMITFEALTGRPGPSRAERWRRAPLPDLRAACPELPEEATRLLTALLQPEPDARPASAEAVLALLRHDARRELDEAFEHWRRGRLPSPEGLMGLFQGPERILRRRSRALALLERRSINTSEDRSAELSAWIASGRARWANGALDLSPADLQWLSEDIPLRPPPDPPPGLKLTPRLTELLTLIYLGWPEATRAALASAWGEDGLDDALLSLVDQSLIHRHVSDAVVSLVTPPGLADPNRRRRLARRWAEALPPDAKSRLRLLLFAGITDAELREAQAAAEALAARGATDEAVMILDRLLRIARERGAVEVERSIHHSRAWMSLSQSGRDPVARGLYELARSALPNEARAPLETLLRAAQRVRGSARDEGLALLHQTPAFEDERLDRWRLGLAVEARNHETAEARRALMERVDAWVAARGTPSAQADAGHWRALAQDTTEDVEAAARIYPAVILGKATRSGQLSSRGSYAVTLMELRRFDEARAEATRLIEEGGALGLPVPVVIGEFVRRASDYREGKALEVDHELAEAVQALKGDPRVAQVLLNEAAIAWRAGERTTSARLAQEAAAVWRPSHHPSRPSLPYLLAEALAAVTRSDDDTAERLIPQLIAGAQPPRIGLALQGLTTLIHGLPRLRERLLPSAIDTFERTPTVYRRGVREILDAEAVLFGTTGPSAP